MTTITFYDSAHPGEIPAGAHALLYRDGLYTPTPAQVKRLGPVRWITVLGGAAVAAHAGAADFEHLNPVYDEPGKLREWAEARLAMKCRARVYSDLNDAKKAHDLVGDLPNVVLWPAIPGPEPTVAQVVAKLAEWGVHVGPAKVWACQYSSAPSLAYDASCLYGSW